MYEYLLLVILVLGINKITEVIFYVEKPEKSAYQIAGVATSEDDKGAKTTSETSGSGDIMALLAAASTEDGEKVFKKCAACHTIAKGGTNKIGPALWGVLGRQAGSVSDYKYSKAMVSYGKTWSIKEMNNFLLKPKVWIKGTKMAFIGLKNEKDRASVILYMNKNTDSPLQLQ